MFLLSFCLPHMYRTLVGIALFAIKLNSLLREYNRLPDELTGHHQHNIRVTDLRQLLLLTKYLVIHA